MQLEAIRKLQRLWDDLDATGGLEEERGSSGLTLVDSIGGSSTWSLWNRIAKKLEALPAPPPPVRGLYLYGQRASAHCCCFGCAALTPSVLAGGVGTGKTMLMDIFSDSLPPGARKKRIHFLDFMLDVHRRLRHLKNVADPLYAVAQARALELVRVSDGGSRGLCLRRSSRACTSPEAAAWCFASTSSWSRTWQTP